MNVRTKVACSAVSIQPPTHTIQDADAIFFTYDETIIIDRACDLIVIIILFLNLPIYLCINFFFESYIKNDDAISTLLA